LKKEYSAIREVSLAASIKLFEDAVGAKRWAAVDYRRHILGVAGKDGEVGKKVDKCILVEKVGSLLDEFTDFEALLVSHNSWLEWPKLSGYQTKILARLSEKERKILLEKSASFGKNKLTYGSTMIFPVSNLALPGGAANPKLLINTVTVVFKNKQKITEKVVTNTKYEDLSRALGLSFSEAERKGIKSIVIPSRISGNYYQGKNEEAVLNIIRDWIVSHPGTGLRTLVVVSKDQTPKTQRKKKSKK
jgi:O-acetyl-ADP-ribose deacetylase (regulator of RNase III)